MDFSFPHPRTHSTQFVDAAVLLAHTIDSIGRRSDSTTDGRSMGILWSCCRKSRPQGEYKTVDTTAFDVEAAGGPAFEDEEDAHRSDGQLRPV